MSKMAVKLGGQNSSSGGSPCHEEDGPLPLRAGAAGGRAGGAAARFTTPVISAALPQGLRADGRSGSPGVVQHQGRRITGSSRYRWVLRVCQEFIDKNLTTPPHPIVKPRAARKRPPAPSRVADNSDPLARIADSADAAGRWCHEEGQWNSVHTRARSKGNLP